MTLQQRFERRFCLYDTAEECADAAAPLFVAHKWKWHAFVETPYIPDRGQILTWLLDLESGAKALSASYRQSGRLIYVEGKFGHERPKPPGKSGYFKVSLNGAATPPKRRRRLVHGKPVLSESEAREAGMRPLTFPLAPDTPELAGVVADMRLVPGTAWAYVDAGSGLLEVWRKMDGNLMKDGRVIRG